LSFSFSFFTTRHCLGLGGLLGRGREGGFNVRRGGEGGREGGRGERISITA
jgi:hypothetical protein